MRRTWLVVLLANFVSVGVLASEEPEEIVVTTSRADKAVVPGTSLKRSADFLFQQLKISNDTPNEDVRKKEILETLRVIANAAEKEKGIVLSLLADSRTIIPMKMDVAVFKMSRGSRIDTSEVLVCVKTPVIPGASNAASLFAKLKAFPAFIKPTGRSAIDVVGTPEISVVNPAQYREAVIKLYAADSKLVTTSLGPEYRVVTKGIDRQMQWVRDGLLEVIFYIPYEYDVIPGNVTSYSR